MTATRTILRLPLRGQTRSRKSCGGTFQADDLVAWLENELLAPRWPVSPFWLATSR